MTLQEAEKQLALLQPKYVLLGIRSDGTRGIPPHYQTDVRIAPEAQVLEMLAGLEGVRVFEMVEAGEGLDWLKKRNDFFAKKTVEQEKEQLRILKERYPND